MADHQVEVKINEFTALIQSSETGLHLPTKQTITIRIDEDILEWLRAQGKGYQTRINAILRLYMQAVQSGEGAHETAPSTERSTWK